MTVLIPETMTAADFLTGQRVTELFPPAQTPPGFLCATVTEAGTVDVQHVTSKRRAIFKKCTAWIKYPVDRNDTKARYRALLHRYNIPESAVATQMGYKDAGSMQRAKRYPKAQKDVLNLIALFKNPIIAEATGTDPNPKH